MNEGKPPETYQLKSSKSRRSRIRLRHSLAADAEIDTVFA
jgi:hypothetical protein